MLQGQHALLELLSSSENAWEIKISLEKVFEAASFETKLPETGGGREKLKNLWKLIRLIEDIETQFKIVEDRAEQESTQK
ncbi:hypothetical protein [Draconibacterium sp.]|uniref:hypothetical protein n=1 Tax=Draconibacterium sp. TaxID=1965318 RepID=UPI00356AA114